ASAATFALVLASTPATLAQETVTIALPSDVATLDPTGDITALGQNIRLNVYDQLTQMSRDGRALPRLAESWSINEDGTVWTFKIRTDAKWHDGEPVTVDDIIWTYTRILQDEKSGVRTYLSKIKDIERVSDAELRITLTEPFAPFDRQVALVSIVSQAAYEK